MRRPLGPEPLDKIVRFRLSATDLTKLDTIAAGTPHSVILRTLIENEWQLLDQKDQ